MADKTYIKSYRLGDLTKTGQTTSYATGDDGDYEKGYPAVTRFIDNGDNTITDMSTGLMWVKDPASLPASNGITPLANLGTWATNTSYVVGDITKQGTLIYVANTNHTSILANAFNISNSYDEGDFVTAGTAVYRAISDFNHPVSIVTFDTPYEVGDIGTNGSGNFFVCVSGYTTISDPIPAWEVGQAYYIDDMVSFSDGVYQCIQDNTSDETNDPNNGAYWTYAMSYELWQWYADYLVNSANWEEISENDPTIWEEFEYFAATTLAADAIINPNVWSRHYFTSVTTYPVVWSKMSWADSITGSAGTRWGGTLTYAGYDDWRLPTINELITLCNYSDGSGCIYSDFTGSVATWSSTTFTTSTSAWGFNFNTNGLTSTYTKTSTTSAYARPVRGNVKTHKSWGIVCPPTGQIVSYANYDDGWFFQRGKYAPQVTAWHEAGTAANDTTAGTVAWSNPDGARTSSSPPYDTSKSAYFASTGTATTSQYLKLTNFGFTDIPANTEIVGVEIEITKSCDGASKARDTSIYLVVGGVIKTTVTVGQTSVYWATNPSASVITHSTLGQIFKQPLTPSIVASSDFGLVIRANLVASTTTAYVDYVRMRIYYSPERLHDNGDGTISDYDTGLMWVKTPNLMIPNSIAVAGNQILADKNAWAFSTAYVKGDGVDVASGWTAGGVAKRFVCIADHTSGTAYATWANSTLYAVDTIVRDGALASWWKCNVGHTSASAPTTFSSDRTANPTYWTQVYPFDLENQSNWTQTIWWDGSLTGTGATFTWANALTNVEALTYAGYDDWYLPNIVELYSTTDKAYSTPPSHPTWFPFNVNSWTWSSTTNAAATTGDLAPYYGGNGNIRSDAKTGSYAFKICRRFM